MIDPVLALLVVIVLVLLLLGGVSAALPGKIRPATGFAAAGVCGLGALLALLSLTLAATDATLELPIGPPGIGFTLSCDPLSGFFLLLVFVTGTAVIAFAAETEADNDPATLAGPVVCTAGLALAVIATDGILLALGLAVANLALWGAGQPNRGRSRQLTVGILAAGAMMVASLLITLGGTGFAPAAIQSGGSDSLFEPIRVPFAVMLAVVCVGALAGLAPLHGWVIAAQSTMPARAAAMLSGAVVPVALYGLLRILFSGAGAEMAAWWGLLLIVLGVVSAVVGAWIAAREATLAGIPAAFGCRQSGLAAIGMGLALIAIAADLPSMARLALGAVFLGVLAQSLCVTLLVLANGAILRSAGSLRLDRLGGLIHRMRLTATCVIVALFGLSALPAGLGFGVTWLLFQAGLAAPRTGTVLPRLLFVVLIAGIALSGALALAAAVRVIGVVFLGRARMPRSSVADELPGPALPVPIALAALSAVFGLFPGVAMAFLAGPAIYMLSGARGGVGTGGLTLLSLDGEGYTPAGIGLLLAIAAVATVAVLRRYGGEERDGPAWNDGFAPTPAWLPFGDPLTQSDGRGFAPESPLPALPQLPRIRIAMARRLGLKGTWRDQGAGRMVLALAIALVSVAVWFGPR